jgi:2-polyprenyl-3-methyl-5-hydroxy-6-metoxy-1,4-benzoquinol methylase
LKDVKNDKKVYCPCCKTIVSIEDKSFSELVSCEICQHRWRNDVVTNQAEYYIQQIERNALPFRYIERKLSERLDALLLQVKDGMRLLEVGCAEGLLGSRIKASRQVFYQGIEPSLDSNIAKQRLDYVFNNIAELEARENQTFDGILAFHVLEHIQDITSEISHWHTLLSSKGWLVLEVPHRSGHSDIEYDANPEHIHQFSIASIACLLTQGGFQIDQLDHGHFESPCYSDSLRVIARLSSNAKMRQEHLIARFKKHLPSPFAIFGIGGDFRNYIAPILSFLPVQAFIDTNYSRFGEKIAGMTIEPYKQESHAGLPVLIASLRYEESILATLQATGHPRNNIYLLGDILEN